MNKPRRRNNTASVVAIAIALCLGGLVPTSATAATPSIAANQEPDQLGESEESVSFGPVISGPCPSQPNGIRKYTAGIYMAVQNCNLTSVRLQVKMHNKWKPCQTYSSGQERNFLSGGGPHWPVRSC